MSLCGFYSCIWVLVAMDELDADNDGDVMSGGDEHNGGLMLSKI